MAISVLRMLLITLTIAKPSNKKKKIVNKKLNRWSRNSQCPGSSALIGSCGLGCRPTSEVSWIPYDRRAEEENDEMSITFSERFYASEFYYGIQQTVSLIDNAWISLFNI